MKSITIHNLDTDLYNAIRRSAKKNRRSLNQEIKFQLAERFLAGDKKNDNKDFKKFLELWDEPDLKEFEEASSEFGSIDIGDWD